MFKGKFSSKHSVLVNSATQNIGARFRVSVSPRWCLAVPFILTLGLFSLLYLSLPTSMSGRAAVAGTISGEIITHTTWLAAESPYVVTGDVTVNPGIRLEIEPGVNVAFDGNYAIHVLGTLIAIGTESQPIRFTSNQASPAAGDWAMLDFRTEGEYGVMEHTIVEYGGNSARYGVGCPSAALCVSIPTFTLNESTVQHNASRGVVLVQSNADITNNTFDDNESEAILMHACNHNIGGCRPTIASNTISNHQRAILRQGAFDPILLNNTATSNDINGIVMQQNASFAGDNHWYADDLPYVVQWSVTVGHPQEHASLTIEPGTVVKFAPATSLTFAYSATVTATGTADQPITFTSLRDDSLGGDTNNDGGATTPSPGDWHLVATSGAGVTASFEHAVFHYGGGWAATGAILGVDIDSTATIRSCEVSHSARHGIFVWRGAHARIEGNVIQNNAMSGIEVSTVGDVLIDSNRILDNTENGIYVYEGHPRVQNNFFQGNAIAVKVNCNPKSGRDCAPVISPHNRFVDSGQEAIRNLAPRDLCVDALENWWGDETGPQDTSSESDACGLVDNPGAGAPVSDGVDYSIWEGGMARPMIAQPGCGTTALSQPTFFGRSLAGSTVSFYDGDTLLGQTTADSDHTFTWTPTEALTDGEHTITAQGTLGDETSLPSQELPLTVDSTLFFDPVGVRISYDFHGEIYSQGMLDETGCASPYGDLNNPLWMRPGTMMTVTVPFRMPVETTSTLAIPHLYTPPHQKDTSTSDYIQQGDEILVTFVNESDETITHLRYSAVKKGIGPDQDMPYTKSIKLKYAIGPKETLTQLLPVGGYDKINFLLESNPGVSYGCLDNWKPDLNRDIEILTDTVHTVDIVNNTGRYIRKFYIVSDYTFHQQTSGGSYVSPSEPLLNSDTLTFSLPRARVDDNYWVVMEDAQDRIHFRRGYWPIEDEEKIFVTFDPSKPGSELTLRNDTGDDIWYLYLYRHNKDVDPFNPNDYVKQGLELGAFFRDLNRIEGPIINKDGDLKIFLEPSDADHRYSLVALDKDGKYLSSRKNFWIEVKNPTFRRLVKECKPPGKLQWCPLDPGKIPEDIIEKYFKRVPQPELESSEGVPDLVSFSASIEVKPGKILLVTCEDGKTEKDTQAGEVLIDPDGYVYDAAQGIEVVIQGATVTCDMYDEDYQAWERWPAELYESQINPQVTGSDGYYAFFVPPGLYQVKATAFGYDPHTSPDIRVIDEVVHYNIPMTGGGGALLLPFVVR
jgi:parallel beta-helix repeat protein